MTDFAATTMKQTSSCCAFAAATSCARMKMDTALCAVSILLVLLSIILQIVP